MTTISGIKYLKFSYSFDDSESLILWCPEPQKYINFILFPRIVMESRSREIKVIHNWYFLSVFLPHGKTFSRIKSKKKKKKNHITSGVCK